jgi:hypothetical protein
MMVNQSDFYNINKNVQFTQFTQFTLVQNTSSGNVNPLSDDSFNYIWIVGKYHIDGSNNFYYILCLSFISCHICGSDIKRSKSDIK